MRDSSAPNFSAVDRPYTAGAGGRSGGSRTARDCLTTPAVSFVPGTAERRDMELTPPAPPARTCQSPDLMAGLWLVRTVPRDTFIQGIAAVSSGRATRLTLRCGKP